MDKKNEDYSYQIPCLWCGKPVHIQNCQFCKLSHEDKFCFVFKNGKKWYWKDTKSCISLFNNTLATVEKVTRTQKHATKVRDMLLKEGKFQFLLPWDKDIYEIEKQNIPKQIELLLYFNNAEKQSLLLRHESQFAQIKFRSYDFSFIEEAIKENTNREKQNTQSTHEQITQIWKKIRRNYILIQGGLIY